MEQGIIIVKVDVRPVVRQLVRTAESRVSVTMVGALGN